MSNLFGGKWNGYRRKMTCEEACEVSLRGNLRRYVKQARRDEQSLAYRWQWRNHRHEITHERLIAILPAQSRLIIAPIAALDDTGAVHLPHPRQQIIAIVQNTNGQDYLLCPCCHEQYTMLYFRPHADAIACRECHDLTYTSCQTYTPAYYARFKRQERLQSKRWREERAAARQGYNAA